MHRFQKSVREVLTMLLTDMPCFDPVQSLNLIVCTDFQTINPANLFIQTVGDRVQQLYTVQFIVIVQIVNPS